MKAPIPTLTIGIAAYNEAQNIGFLLGDLQSQHLEGVTLADVMIVSDASTDATESVARSVKGLPVTIHRNKQRSGLGASLNTIFSSTKSDMVVTLDADIRISDKNFLAKLIRPILNKQADYTSSSIEEMPTHSFFTHALTLSMQVKRKMYRLIGNGNNIYTSFGLARGYTKKLYAVLRFPTSVGNDMYGYLYCIANKYRFAHVPHAAAKYYLPRTLREHVLQSTRFFHARQNMSTFFAKKIVDDAFLIPLGIYIKGLVYSIGLLIRYPVHACMYTVFLLGSYVYSRVAKTDNTWTISETTKGSIESSGRFSLFVHMRGVTNIFLGRLQRLFRVKPLPLTILCYHGIGDSSSYFNVSEGEFAKQMKYLHTHTTFVTLDQIRNFLTTGERLPQPAVAITFDDGYKSILHIRSIIKKYNIQPTVFVLSDPEHANRTELDNQESFLRTEDLRSLKDEGWSIGSHTATHADLAKTKGQELEKEVYGSKTTLEKSFTTRVDYIAYPKGVYTKEVLQKTQKSGYTLGLTMDDGTIVERSNPLCLPRIGINASHKFTEFVTLPFPLNSAIRTFIKKFV